MDYQRPALLVTGGAGFIGSNFIVYYMKKYPDKQIINLDNLTYAGDTANLEEVEHHPNYHFIQGDIADEDAVTSIFSTYNIEGVINFAAESHVDRSIVDAKQFVTSNVLGTLVLLQAAKLDWEKRGVLESRRFHHISTDEVYGDLGETGKFHEATPYDPQNPYSASKAGANLLVKSFGYTYGMNIVLSSSSNNYGPKQHTEKLIPTIITRALHNQTIPIYGDGENIRDWLYVEDHCRALDVIYHHGKAMEMYNVGGGNEITNIDIAKEVCRILDIWKPEMADTTPAHFEELIAFTEDRKGHDRRYAVDDTKIRNELEWKPLTAWDTGIQNTVKWYIEQWKTNN